MWCIPVIPVLERLKQDCFNFKVRLNYITRLTQKGTNKLVSQAWWHTPVILTLGMMLRQEDFKFEASLDYTVSLASKISS